MTVGRGCRHTAHTCLQKLSSQGEYVGIVDSGCIDCTRHVLHTGCVHVWALVGNDTAATAGAAAAAAAAAA
jgi:hypothetical protein